MIQPSILLKMDRANDYRFKAPHKSSSSSESRKYQDMQVSLLKEMFPALPVDTIQDILVTVDWKVDCAIEILEESKDGNEYEDYSSYEAPTKDNNKELFLEITKLNGVQVKDSFNFLQQDDKKKKPLASDSYSKFPQMFPVLPSPASPKKVQTLNNGSNRGSPVRVNSPVPLQIKNDSRSYNPPKPGQITVYNALQDSAPWFQINNSWNTKCVQPQNGEISDVRNMEYVDNSFEERAKLKKMYEDEEVLHSDDIYTQTDGEDWFNLQLVPDFALELFNTYSNPFGAVDVGRLLYSDLNIRIPPKLAFELFRHLCLSLLQKFPENSNQPQHEGNLSEVEGACGYTPLYHEVSNLSSQKDVTLDLRKIMELEMRLEGEEIHRVKQLRSNLQSTLSSKLSIDNIKSAFPSLSSAIIEATFVENNSRFEETLEQLKRQFPNNFIEQGLLSLSEDKTIFNEAVQSELQVLIENTKQKKKNQRMLTPTELRVKAQTHFFLMREYAQKRAESSNAPGIAEYYTEMSRIHSQSMHEANRMASDMIFAQNNNAGKPTDHIDLHHLSVQEAMNRLAVYLHDRDNYIRTNGLESLQVKIVCGRGRHSDIHGPKIGPAVIRHLHGQGHDFRDTHSEGYVYVTLRNKNLKNRKQHYKTYSR